MRKYRFWILTTLLTLFQGQSFAREWSDASGKYRIEADLVAVRGDKVILEKKDGTITSVPIAKLSAADQEYLKQQATPQAATPRSSDASAQAANATKGAVSANSAGDSTQPELAALATRAQAILKANCFRCHGEDNSSEGGFGFALDREKLVASGYVVPKDAARSPLIERMNSKDSPMPPEGELSRPSSEEMEEVQAWIAAGAPHAGTQEIRPFISTAQVFASIAADLKSLNERDRASARYFSAVHLANSGLSDEEIETYRVALAKLINSLSWGRKLASLQPLKSQPFVFRIDLRSLKWTPETWEQILASYPHGTVFESRDAYNVRLATECEIPLIRADWFVATASRPPLYHELAQIPVSDAQLEALLQVDVEKNLEEERALRVGFARSGVSQNNRLIERHDSVFGAYWKSYDFAENIGRKNLFENPIGPGVADGTFAHDGGEIIFHLPNGMLGFMLTDASGLRIDRGPVEIVSDPRQPDRTVVNGVSCMSCHYGGFISKADEIRNHVLANDKAYEGRERILQLYPSAGAVDKWYVDDSKVYLAALAKQEIGIGKPTQAGEPIVLVSNRYLNELDLRTVAAELGMQAEAFEAKLAEVVEPELKQSIGVLKTKGGVIKRDAFDPIALQLATHFKLGNRPTGEPPQATPRAAVAANRNAAPQAGNSAAANEALKAGVEAVKKQQWQQAEDYFATAIKRSNDRLLTARIYETAVPLFERNESIEKLIEAHMFLLDSCKNTTAIEQARANFYNSVLRSAQKSDFWSMRVETSTSIRWHTTLPTSTSNAIAEAFEQKLAETPNHEPSLRVMQLFWEHVQLNPKKRMEVLQALRDVHKARKEYLDIMAASDLATLLVENGDAATGAEIFAEIAGQLTGNRAANFRIMEADGWSKADQKQKAMAALSSATKELVKRPDTSSTYDLVKAAELYLTIDEPKLAVDVYKSVLKVEKQPYAIRDLQDKINAANAMIVDNGDAGGKRNDDMGDLLDPGLSYRKEAETHEESAKRGDSSQLHYLMQAGESWIKANDMKKAAVALNKAATLLRRKTDTSVQQDQAKLAGLYRDAKLMQESVNHLVASLKLAKSEYDIEKIQTEISALMAEDASIKSTPEIEKLLDPKYKYRVMAIENASQKTYDANSNAANLVKTVEVWGQAGEVKEVKRLGPSAESAIKAIGSNNSYRPEEQLSAKLAKTYDSVELYEDAVRCYALAIKFAVRDDDAAKYYHQIKVICDEKGIKLPVLDAESAAKTDPFNRFRVEAADLEKKAAEATGSLSEHYIKQAAETWHKAQEKENAFRVANEFAAKLSQQNEPRERELTWLAEFYQKLGYVKEAVQTYEQVLALTKSNSAKKRIQAKIDVLKN